MTAELIIQCAWCRAVQAGEEYVQASPVPWLKVSHGMCPACFRVQVEDLTEAGVQFEARSPEMIVTHEPEVVIRLVTSAATKQEAA